MKYGLNETTISKINSVFAAHPKIKQVKIYGSRAKGTHKNGSDIDLCLFADNLSNNELNRIKNELDDLMLAYSIDLCDYGAIGNNDLKEHIDRVGDYFYRSVRVIEHYENVDIANIEESFMDENRHRCFLKIPFLERDETGETICVIGQNPSDANSQVADKTLRFMEEFVYLRFPDASKMIMLNLYTRVDTNKEYTENLDCAECNIQDIIAQYNTFICIFGKLKKQGEYNFPEKARPFKNLLDNKAVYKIDIRPTYAPHPGNPLIMYHNPNKHGIRIYNLEDM